MRKVILLCAMAVGLTTLTQAQSKVITVQPNTIVLGGDFNNGSGDTSLQTYSVTTVPGYGYVANPNLPAFQTRNDSVTHTGSANDSVRARVPGYYHYVGFEIHAKQVGAVRADSTTFYVWGTKTPGNGQGSFKLLTSFTMANIANEQVFTYDVPNGNSCTNYRITALNGNLSANSMAQWQATMLLR